MFAGDKKKDHQKQTPEQILSPETPAPLPSGEGQETPASLEPQESQVPKPGKSICLKESEYQKMLKDLSDYKDKYLRLFAEFENSRKRMEREKIEFIRYANEELLGEFLNILDDLERSVEAAKANHEDYTAFLKGVEMVMAHLYEMLKKNGVRPIEAKGKPFDPHCHEALMVQETDQAQEDLVIEEFQKGYFLGEHVLRIARVKVAKPKQPENGAEPAAPKD